MVKKRFTILCFFSLFAVPVFAQFPRFSFSTDVGALRSFREDQRYWVVSHMTHLTFNFNPRDALSLWIGYTSDGKFHNDLVAGAKSSTTVPQQISYRNNAELRFKHFSMGWKRWIKGNFVLEEGVNIYGYGGFGLMMGRIFNSHDPFIDTILYNVEVSSGGDNFKRLTFDIGVGLETPIGNDLFLYGDGRVLIPTTDYPSKYLFVNNNAPFVAMLSLGVRIIF
jgi:hypothetical protein